ncbi:hypothetical protein HRbin28_01832 [bacterium HR28]|nr:hypothetical protein HRbin28_01832 [bacterium HR28]
MRRSILLLAIALTLLLATPAPGLAQAEPRPTALLIEAPAAVPVGERFAVVARLSGPSGEIYGAVENEVLQLLIDGIHFRRERTNFAGAAQFVLTQPLPVGPHTLTVVYQGSSSLAPAAASAIVTIAPAVLEIETVPALPGIAVRALGKTFTTGTNGTVQIPFDQPGSYQIEVSRTIITPEQTARFSRWNDDWFSPLRTVIIPKHRHLQAGYDVETAISYRFIDLDGQPVDPRRIERVVLKSSIGEVRELVPDSAQMTVGPIKASRAIPTVAGLTASSVQWSIEAVYVRGTNVVNRKQQRFYPIDERDWTITLLLYTATFSVRDIFFGLPVGQTVRLTYPDGSNELVPLQDGRGVARSLPRGEYRVQATGIYGWSPTAPLALSRNQDVDLTVLSGLDLLLILILVSASATALVLAGRPQLRHLRRWIAENRRLPAPQAETEGRARRLALIALLALTLSGTIFLTQGLARSQRPRPSTASTVVQRVSPTAAPATVPRVSTPEPESTPEPLDIRIAPEFAAFWETNGALAVFGVAVDAPRWAVGEDGMRVYLQDFTFARLEYRPNLVGTPYAIQLARLGTEEAELLGLLESEPFRRRSADTPPSADCTYFTQTGHWLCGSFRAFWRRNGLELGDPGISARESLALLGYPISEAFVDEAGRTVQYFERAKLVAYPEFRGTANEVIRDPVMRRTP